MLKYSALITIISVSSILHTSEIAIKNTFKEYLKTNDKKILIVGCGHTPGYDGNHSHLGCWCVDIDRKDDTLPTPWWQRIEADAELDITDIHATLPYKSQFDVIVLEGLWEQTLNNPYTLYNAAYMLKTNGELVIDTYKYFTYDFYKKYQNNIPKNILPSTTITKKLESYGYDAQTIPHTVKKLQGIAYFLQTYCFIDVITLSKAYQEYAARKTCLLSATKTAATEEILHQWLDFLKKNNETYNQEQS